jgi:hypothetical protein
MLNESRFLYIGTFRGHNTRTILKREVVTKSIGLIIDENLSWEEHVNYITRKVSKGLGMLRRIRDLMPINTLDAQDE